MRVRTHRLVALAAATVLVAGCSGDGDDGAAPTTTGAASSTSTPSTSEPTTTSAAPTTAATTTTTAAPTTTSTAPPTTTTTTPPTSTAPSTAATTTEPAPTTTSQADFVAAVERDWREGLRLFDVAAQAPTDAAAVAAALDYTIDGVQTGTQEYLASLAADGQRLVPSPEIQPSQTILAGPERDPQRPLEVEMTTCEVNPWIVVDAADPTVVVNDQVFTTQWTARLRFDVGRWKLSALTVVDQWEGVRQCDA